MYGGFALLYHFLLPLPNMGEHRTSISLPLLSCAYTDQHTYAAFKVMKGERGAGKVHE